MVNESGGCAECQERQRTLLGWLSGRGLLMLVVGAALAALALLVTRPRAQEDLT